MGRMTYAICLLTVVGFTDAANPGPLHAVASTTTHGRHHAMYTSFAAGTLIVLGVLITVLGFLAGGRIEFVGLGLGAILAAGLLGLVERRITR